MPDSEARAARRVIVAGNVPPVREHGGAQPAPRDDQERDDQQRDADEAEFLGEGVAPVGAFAGEEGVDAGFGGGGDFGAGI